MGACGHFVCVVIETFAWERGAKDLKSHGQTALHSRWSSAAQLIFWPPSCAITFEIAVFFVQQHLKSLAKEDSGSIEAKSFAT